MHTTTYNILEDDHSHQISIWHLASDTEGSNPKFQYNCYASLSKLTIPRFPLLLSRSNNQTVRMVLPFELGRADVFSLGAPKQRGNEVCPLKVEMVELIGTSYVRTKWNSTESIRSDKPMFWTIDHGSTHGSSLRPIFSSGAAALEYAIATPRTKSARHRVAKKH